jgi:hypothetical protein
MTKQPDLQSGLHPEHYYILLPVDLAVVAAACAASSSSQPMTAPAPFPTSSPVCVLWPIVEPSTR